MFVHLVGVVHIIVAYSIASVVDCKLGADPPPLHLHVFYFGGGTSHSLRTRVLENDPDFGKVLINLVY